MIETIDLPANLPLGGVWQDTETQRLYFRLGELLLAARVGSIPQGKAALFVRGIEGDFFNVMGLPLCRLGEMLKKQGVIIL